MYWYTRRIVYLKLAAMAFGLLMGIAYWLIFC